MDITFSHRAALAIIRAQRMRRATCGRTDARRQSFATSDTPPVPSALPSGQTIRRSRWSRTLVIECLCRAGLTSDDARELFSLEHVDVLKRKGVRRTRVSGCRSWDDRSGVALPEGISTSTAPHVLAQLAELMPLPALMCVAAELMGAYALPPLAPPVGTARGSTTFGVEALVTKAELLHELAMHAPLPATLRALRAVVFAGERAWSPQEALLATMLALPGDRGGYELGPLTLNARVMTGIGNAMTCASRVPDILLACKTVGINYDGWGHFGIMELERAAVGLGQDPGSDQRAHELAVQRRALREKYVDDRRRDRELLVAGVETLVATSEDLRDVSTLDLLVRQLIVRAEAAGGQRMARQRALLESESLAHRRAEVLASLRTLT